MTQLVWLRNDLRLDDNPALFHASKQGLVRVVFVATPAQWRDHNDSPAKTGLKATLLHDLDKRLGALGIELDIISTDTFANIPTLLLNYCQQHAISDIWFNAETPFDEIHRDQSVKLLLQQHAITTHESPNDLIVNQPVMNQQGQPFKVFTPYYRRWLTLLTANLQKPWPEPLAQGDALTPSEKNIDWAGNFRRDLWTGTEQDAQQKLYKFCQNRLFGYAADRDHPAIPGTSTLSPYLATGTLGPRRLVETIQVACAQTGRDWLSDDWLRELAWRDFYRQLMLHFPRLNKNRAFKPETDSIIWNVNSLGFDAWCEGRTGFPIVDAAMRQLKQTGWMHNRLRMVAASFLTKLLFIDWREGERFFMQHLIDGEFAANNGGWQWSASTGCDAAPYFRVFNPTRQSERFDPNGDFIHRFVPELATLTAKHIHDPKPDQRKMCGYPDPIVDYKMAREYAIARFAENGKNKD